MTTKPSVIFAAAVTVLVALTGCKTLEVPNYNGGSVGELETAPTRTAVLTAAQGVLYGTRDNGWRIKFAGQVGREGWDLDPTNQEAIQGPLVLLEPGRYYVVFLYNQWYQNIRLANVALDAVEVVTDMTAAEKEAVRGFLKTIQAWDFLMLAEVFDASGLPVDVDHAPGSTLAPVATKTQVYARINQLLDEAKTHLQAGGASFPFSLSPGFAGFTTPTTFLKFNRAVKARANT
ncbi:MAG: RagB/SusD family nutrient uptake outer membrane protein, partial [Gemmatimonadetes bacterium]|nr:RagB/SusD family nutrient uptake outer membrane protein [Gemmatimonadota bacterium]